MANRRLLRAEIDRADRRIRQLEAELAALRSRRDAAWARLLDAELKP